MNIILEDYKSHKEGLLAQGFWALVIYRLGAARRKFSSPLIRKPWGLIHKILVKFCEIFLGISINMHAQVGRRVIFEHFGYIIIHANAIIGDDVIIRQGVTIGNRYLDRPLDAPQIGSRVNVGAGACILGAIKIGNDVDIGANAVVLQDVPDFHIAVGIPARLIPKNRGGAS